MAWVVDTCLLIDIAEADPSFHKRSVELLESKRNDGLRICPVTFVELAPVFAGNLQQQWEFVFNLEIPWPDEWTLDDTHAAHTVWNDLIVQKRAGWIGKRPVADVLIGVFAERHGGLLTRNAADFAKIFPKLKITEP